MFKDPGEDKLLCALCKYLPYGLVVNTPDGDGYLSEINMTIFGTEYGVNIKATERERFTSVIPYLRDKSSMTFDELEEYRKLQDDVWIFDERPSYHDTVKSVNWLISNKFDVDGLIYQGLAIETTEEINPYKVK